jgi:sulfatase modifying factor 1
VKNVQSAQVGNRVQFTYDLAGEEREAEVTVNLTVPGGDRKTADLHLEGDVGKVKPGRGKVIWWNVLQDFPRGLNSEIAWEITAGGQSFTDTATGMEFVFVKGGCYEMGDTFGDGRSYEKPVHNVCVSDFSLGKYEVTQGQWQAVMGNNPANFKDCGANCPVEQVSWNDTQDFIRRLNGKTGKSYRLPTEAEWEYAARSGGQREKYSGGNDLDRVAWYNANSGGKTHTVGTKAPNGIGLYDMSGNVWEWCQDWYGEKYYNDSPRSNPQGPSSGQYRVLRGGSWDNRPEYVRAAYRVWSEPADRNNNNGFRLSLSAP